MSQKMIISKTAGIGQWNQRPNYKKGITSYLNRILKWKSVKMMSGRLIRNTHQ